jgi:hypothetical protein
MGVDGPLGSGRALRLDPFALPVRYTALDGGTDGQIRHVEIDRERVVVWRAMHGIRMNVSGAAVHEYRGVVMRTLAPGPEQSAVVTVILEHCDGALSVPLFIATEGDDAAAQWKSWGRVLGVPLLVADNDGSLREPYRRIGRIGVDAPTPRRRRRAAIRSRRPSILMRRKPGRPQPVPLVYRGEGEIIAKK